MYENGERVPSDQIKIKLASLYGKSVGYIFFDEDDTLSD
jgi:putative transcriptional regulator